MFKETEKYNQLNDRFQKAIKSLEGNLDYMRSKEGMPVKVISINEQILKALRAYAENMDGVIDALNTEADQIAGYNMQLKEENKKLKAICHVHGIWDYNHWLNTRTWEELNSMATDKELWYPEAFQIALGRLSIEHKKQIDNLVKQTFTA